MVLLGTNYILYVQWDIWLLSSAFEHCISLWREIKSLDNNWLFGDLHSSPLADKSIRLNQKFHMVSRKISGWGIFSPFLSWLHFICFICLYILSFYFSRFQPLPSPYSLAYLLSHSVYTGYSRWVQYMKCCTWGLYSSRARTLYAVLRTSHTSALFIFPGQVLGSEHLYLFSVCSSWISYRLLSPHSQC